MLDRFGEDELVQLTDFQRAGAIDDTILNTALQDADERINSLLRGGYSLPFPQTPRELKPIACDLARWFLYRHEAPQHVKDAAEIALRMLRDYASGTARIDLEAAGVSAQTDTTQGNQATVVSSNDRVFGQETLEKMA